MGLYIVIGIWIAILIATILESDSYDDKADNIMGVIFGGAIFFGFIIFIGFFVSSGTTGKDVIEHNKYCNSIISIKGASSTSGTFFLGCGSIGSNNYYVYYEVQPNGSYKQKKISVDYAAIIEEENGQPRISWEGTRYLCSSWFVPKWLAPPSGEVMSERIIYVPKGTIIKTFKLD